MGYYHSHLNRKSKAIDILLGVKKMDEEEKREYIRRKKIWLRKSKKKSWMILIISTVICIFSAIPAILISENLNLEKDSKCFLLLACSNYAVYSNFTVNIKSNASWIGYVSFESKTPVTGSNNTTFQNISRKCSFNIMLFSDPGYLTVELLKDGILIYSNTVYLYTLTVSCEHSNYMLEMSFFEWLSLYNAVRNQNIDIFPFDYLILGSGMAAGLVIFWLIELYRIDPNALPVKIIPRYSVSQRIERRALGWSTCNYCGRSLWNKEERRSGVCDYCAYR